MIVDVVIVEKVNERDCKSTEDFDSYQFILADWYRAIKGKYFIIQGQDGSEFSQWNVYQIKEMRLE